MAKAGAEANIAVALNVDGLLWQQEFSNDAYLIRLRLAWEKGLFQRVRSVFGSPKLESWDCSDKPTTVFTGDFQMVTRSRVLRGTEPGTIAIAGKLQRQGFNECICLRPAPSMCGRLWRLK